MFSDDAEAIRIFLQNNKNDVNKLNTKSESPLSYATSYNRTDCLDVLLEHGADVNLTSTFRKTTALHVASGCGYIDIVTRLLNYGCDANIRDYLGVTPIMEACRYEHFEIVKILTLCSNFNLVDNFNCDIFTSAIESDNNEIIDYVFDFVHNGKESYLHHAIHNDNEYAVKLLLLKGTDINSITSISLLCNSGSFGFTPLYRACINNQGIIVDILIKNGAHINLISGYYQETPLHGASREANVDIVTKLLNAGADFNIQNKEGFTPITDAHRCGKMDVVKQLLNAGATFQN